MGDGVTVLIAASIIVPIVVVLIYAAFRNFFTSARNLGEAVDDELARRRNPDADQVLSGKSVQSEHRVGQTGVPREAADSQLDDLTKRRVASSVSELMANIQAEAKKSDDAHKSRIRAHVDRKIPPISQDGRKMIERALRARLASSTFSRRDCRKKA